MSRRTSSERIKGTDIVRRSKKTGIRTIPELTDKSLIDDTNVGNFFRSILEQIAGLEYTSEAKP